MYMKEEKECEKEWRMRSRGRQGWGEERKGRTR
jgi:hypothetical protein